MAKLEFEFDFDEILTVLEKADEAITAPIARKVGKTVTGLMKRQIGNGISPIVGSGLNKRFQAYRGSYAEGIKRGYKRYRDNGKSLRPVNLRLTGEFLKNLDYEIEKKDGSFTTRVGFFDSDSIDKELGHRKGTNGQAKRPIIPTVQEKFNAVIVDAVETIYEDAIEKHLSDKLE